MLAMFLQRHTYNPQRLTLWRCDVGVIQRVDDSGVILAKGQVFYQMGHVNLQKDKFQQ